VIVLARPLAAQLVDAEGHNVGVSGGGMVSAAPARLSVDGGPWTAVTGWAGPWPTDERWWSAPRRQARMQVVTGAGTAHLLTRERGGWWLEGTYD
jgi:protein ImuB